MQWKLPRDVDDALDLSDFRKLSRRRRGSRDVGAQLFCALLRSVGLMARLVVSLQPLPVTTTSAPTIIAGMEVTSKKAIAQFDGGDDTPPVHSNSNSNMFILSTDRVHEPIAHHHHHHHQPMFAASSSPSRVEDDSDSEGEADDAEEAKCEHNDDDPSTTRSS